MATIYDEIISSAEAALADFSQTEELLEYPEVQADKAYFLSVLSHYNEQKAVREKLAQLQSALSQEAATVALLSESLSEEERAEAYLELSTLRRRAVQLSTQLSYALGRKNVLQSAFCRAKATRPASAKILQQLVETIFSHFAASGVKVTNLHKSSTPKGGEQVEFVATGSDALSQLLAISGTHKVRIANLPNEEISLFAMPAEQPFAQLSENDVKIELFHSGGAGGQNVNKVETAVRAIHLPTNTVVVCQDERSQLSNKRRALQTLFEKLSMQNARLEKQRMEADMRAQQSQSSPIVFDVTSAVFSDARLSGAQKMTFPPTQEEFATYLNTVISKGN